MNIAQPIFYFCERGVEGLISEPSSVMSLLPTFLLGIYIFVNAKGKFKTKEIFLALTVLYVAIGSGIMHTINTPLTRVLDGSSMILLVSYLTLLIYPINTIGKVIFITYNIIANIFLFTNPKIALILFIINTIFLIINLLKNKKSKSYLTNSLIFFTLGFLFWLTDTTKFLCNPNNHIVTGHAIWHISIAVGIYFTYRYFKQASFCT